MSIKALIISDYRDTVGVRPEAEIFIGLKKEGFEIEVMTFGDSEYAEIFRKNGIQVIDFHPVKKISFSEMVKIRKVLKKGNYHILHLLSNRSLISGILASLFLKVKVVLYRGFAGHIHWYDPVAYLKFLSPRVSKIICASEFTKENIAKNIINKGKLVTISKGHSVDWYKNVSNYKLDEFNIPKDAFVITNVANERPMKGTKYLLGSSKYLPEGLNIHYLLVGKGRDTKENLTEIEQTAYKDNVHFAGFSTNALGMVKSSDVFVLSSLKGEAVTKAVVEAMAVKTAPVITDIGGNRGLVLHEETGFVVPKEDSKAIADAVLRLYNDRSLCKKYSENAYNHLQNNFNLNTSVEKTKKLYEELILK